MLAYYTEYGNWPEEKFWGLVGYMVKMLKLNFPTQNNHFWRTGACATRNDQIFVVFFIHGWHGGGRKGVICMAENKYYWNLSCYSTTLSVCNVFQEVWLQYEKVWGLQWVRPPQGLRGPQKQAKIGGVVWASKKPKHIRLTLHSAGGPPRGRLGAAGGRVKLTPLTHPFARPKLMYAKLIYGP